ncbi:UDP-glucosyltransferase 2-like [Epargyreus clarus]|uniref:UDP-glucosyltransferase 2-like n=1 Tax=Epargyreus clarus TaxID=520877 RepID=UPI003C303718
MNHPLRLWILLALILCGHVNQAYRILLVSPFPSSSHAILGDATVQTLVDAGHEIVYVTAFPRNFTNPNIFEVDVSAHKDQFPTHLINLEKLLKNEVDQSNLWKMLSKTSFFAEQILRDEGFQKVITDGQKFDLVIAEWMFSELYAGLATLLNCPLVWFSTTEPHDMIVSLVDEARNPAYSHQFLSSIALPFTFIGRASQLLISWIFFFIRTFFIMSVETSTFERIYAPLMSRAGKRLPSYDEVRYNASLVLSNSYVSMGESIRLPQNYIPIGGYHINSIVKPLTSDVQKIMDNAKNGVIYFSMGSIAKSKDFPEKMKMNLLEMFSGLKQTVIWKFESDFPNLPPNVHVVKWANQQAILAHPNCVLFISHGGLLSLTESIHYGKPIIGIPAFADQFTNVARGERKGYARKVDLSYNLADDLKAGIDEVLGNPRYTEKARALSLIHHDRPIHPRKELVHWVEHVIKTHGAPHLRSPAIDVPWYQKLFLDLALIIAMTLLILRFFLKMMVAKCFSKGESSQMMQKKKL